MPAKDQTTIKKREIAKSEEPIKFKGRYISAVGKRKSAVARVRLYRKGSGAIIINGERINQYFSLDKITLIKQPLKLSGYLRDLNFSVFIKGGGQKGRAEAVRHGLARALVAFDEGLKPSFKTKDWLTRDARRKERKKPGLKKARRAPQWSKR